MFLRAKLIWQIVQICPRIIWNRSLLLQLEIGRLHVSKLFDRKDPYLALNFYYCLELPLHWNFS